MADFSTVIDLASRPVGRSKAAITRATPIASANDHPTERSASDSNSRRRRASDEGGGRLLDQNTIDAINNTLRDLPKKTSLNWKRIAELSGLPNGNVFYNLQGGHSRLLSLETYIRLSKALGISMDELLGLEACSISSGPDHALVVRAKAQRSVFQASPDLPLNLQSQVMLPITAKQRALGAYGVEYFGFSEGSRSTRRTILVVLPFRPASDTLCPGQEVIVHSRRSSGVEVALAEVTTATNGLTLRFSDSNPASNEPLIYPIKRDGHVVTAKAKNISIEAIVIGKWESAKS